MLHKLLSDKLGGVFTLTSNDWMAAETTLSNHLMDTVRCVSEDTLETEYLIKAVGHYHLLVFPNETWSLSKQLYVCKKIRAANVSLWVVVEHPEKWPIPLHLGELKPLHKQRTSLLGGYVSKEEVDTYVEATKSFTLSEIKDAISFKNVTNLDDLVKRLNELRLTTIPLRRLKTDNGYYMCPDELSKWIDFARKSVQGKIPEDLSAKGVLLGGHAGTGKTSGAKHVAESLGLPLYLLSASSFLSKWIGDSEQMLTKILSRVSDASPCVLLLDEVEKIFSKSTGENDSAGASVVSRLLSILLWWLQEDSNGVFIVMTTNNVDAIPPELIRSGRIDTCISINLFSCEEEVTAFVDGFIKHFEGVHNLTIDKQQCYNYIRDHGEQYPRISAAAVENLCKKYIIGEHYE